MSIANDPIIGRLSVLKQRLLEAKKENVRRIAGVDLYHIPDARVRRAWERRMGYYEALSRDPTFLTMEDAARDAAMSLASVAQTIALRLSAKDAKRISDWFWPPRRDITWEDGSTLDEKLQSYLEKKNYYSIREVGDVMLGAHPYDEGIYYNCNNILAQHQKLYEHCQRFGRASRQIGTEPEQAAYLKSFQALSGYIDELELRLIQEPRKMHLGNFEEVQLAASAFDHTVLGHITKGFQSSQGDNEDLKTEEIRKAAIDVCEEIISEISLPTEISFMQPREKIVHINDVQIDTGERREVTYKGISFSFKLGGLPWSLIRRCCEENNGEFGKVAVDEVPQVKTSDALHREVNRMNKPWRAKIRENVFRVQDGYFCIAPKPMRQTLRIESRVRA